MLIRKNTLPKFAQMTDLDPILMDLSGWDAATVKRRISKTRRLTYVATVDKVYAHRASAARTEAQRIALAAYMEEFQKKYVRVVAENLYKRLRIEDHQLAEGPTAENKRIAFLATRDLAKELRVWVAKEAALITKNMKMLSATDSSDEKVCAEREEFLELVDDRLKKCEDVDAGTCRTSKSLLLSSVMLKANSFLKRGDTTTVQEFLARCDQYAAGPNAELPTKKAFAVMKKELAAAIERKADISQAQTTSVTNNGITVVKDEVTRQLFLTFPGIPSRNLIEIIRSRGWRWMSRTKIWQRAFDQREFDYVTNLAESAVDYQMTKKEEQ